MEPKQNFLQRIAGGFNNLISSHQTIKAPQVEGPQDDPYRKYNIPPVIPYKSRKLFIERARIAGVEPEAFGTISRREQGANTTPEQAALVGGVDPTDRGVMQVNKLNEPMIRERFIKEMGREYNANDTDDSIIAASMVLEENRRIFEQKKKNGTLPGGYTPKDLIDSYNMGPDGVIQARRGDPDKVKRLERYQSAGL
jgi:hypothetical protein